MFKILTKKNFWVVLITAGLLFSLIKYSSGSRPEITGVEKVLRDALAPLQSGIYGFREQIQGIGINFADKKVLDQTIQNLKADNDRLKTENQKLREYQAEVDRLRTILNFQQNWQDQYNLESARVIARSPGNWYETIIIDKGTRDGISPDMPVINPDGLVGKVGSCSKSSSQIWLITDRDMAVGAILQETRETTGIVEGMGESNVLRMINIPYYADVEKGERVISSGLSQTYPKGITIGTIFKVTREPSGLVQSATITPAVDFDKLEEVLVIKNYHPLPDQEQNTKE